MRSKYLVAAALLIATAAPLHGQSVKAGIEAWQRADYTGAVAIWRPLAEKGDADAQFNLGQAYRLGRGVPTNVAAAQTWFERAAGQGHVDAETTLGLLLFQNGDQAAGLKWLRKAADHGEPRAMLVYGTALFNGDGVPQDPVRGYAYVSRSAAQGLAPAKQTLDQLEQLLPAADRKRGLVIARELAEAAPAPTAAATKVAIKPAETASLNAAPKPAPKAKTTQVAAAPATAEKKPGAPPAKAVAKSEAPPAKTVAKSEPAATPAPAPATGAWRVQLGAFSNRGNAEALYKKLAGKDALAGRRAFYVAAGAVTRLQVGPFESKGSAAAACKAVGVPCFPVAAK